MVEYDVIIKNASITEGTGEKEYVGSLGIIDDKIVSTGNIKGDAIKIINAKGLKALPGFIDAHSHAERNILWYPYCENYVMQGVTTFIGGQCGGSPAPLTDEISLPGMLSDYQMEISPFKFSPEKSTYPIDQVNAWMKERYGWTIDWQTMAEFFKHIEKTGFGVNFAPLVGHGTIRRNVMGKNYERDSTKQEREQMHEIIHSAMRDGCIGMSAGLDYDPDIFSSQEEIIEAVTQLKEYNGVYSPHWRRTGRRRGSLVGRVTIPKISSMLECVEVYEKTGVRLHFAHLDSGWNIYPEATDEVDASILKATFDTITSHTINKLDITWNTIPFYTKGGFSVLPYLSSVLSPWLRELGSRKELAKWLQVKEFREEIMDAIRTGKLYISVEHNPFTNPKWVENTIVVKHINSSLDGKSLSQIAVERKIDPIEVWFNLIIEDPDSQGIRLMNVNPKTYYLFYKHPCGCLGLDLMGVFDKEYQSPYPPYTIPGINTYSAFPIFFEKFVKQDKTLSLEEAVQATSTKATMIHGLKGRGTICEGSYADIVLMDFENLKNKSNEIEPRNYPQGINHVFVKGVQVVEKGKLTKVKPGKVLRRAAD